VRALLFLALSACTPAAELGRNRDGKLYDVAFGTVYCAQAVWTHCGYLLGNCSDGHTYHCMVNVRERGE